MLLKTYLLVHSHAVGTEEEVRDYIDALPEIVNWMHVLPNTFLIVSAWPAEQLANRLHSDAPEGAWFLILNTRADKNGWLSPDAWEFMLHPKPVLDPPPPPRLIPKRPKRPPTG